MDLAQAGRSGRASLAALASRTERTLIVLTLFTYYCIGYFRIGNGPTDVEYTLLTALDRRIPFVPESIFVYASVYFLLLLPLFVVRCPALLRRVALGYAITIGVAFASFLAWPVTSLGLRADLTALDPAHLTTWGMRTLYALDPPRNLFPSLHVAVAALAALAAHKAGSPSARVAIPWVGAIAISTCTVKQHFWVDGAVGLLVGAAVYALVVRPFAAETRRRHELAFPWLGPTSFLGTVVGGYLGFYAAFRLGVEPWTWLGP